MFTSDMDRKSKTANIVVDSRAYPCIDMTDIILPKTKTYNTKIVNSFGWAKNKYSVRKVQEASPGNFIAPAYFFIIKAKIVD